MHPKYRAHLPQLSPRDLPFLAEGGLETELIFHKGFELPHFAAFVLLESAEGRKALQDFYISYIKIAKQYRTGIVLQVPTWRLSEPWVKLLGYADPARTVAELSVRAVELLAALRSEFEDETTPIVISGSVGSFQDAYKETDEVALASGLASCKAQIGALSRAGVDMISLMTVSSAKEAIAVIELARDASLPVTVSFTVETDGLLLGRHSLLDTIRKVDEATNGYAAYFGINCAHPKHILAASREFMSPEIARVKMIRCNASEKSHQELDNAESLDRGNLQAFTEGYQELYGLLPELSVVGGCCGTNDDHVRAIAAAIFER